MAGNSKISTDPVPENVAKNFASLVTFPIIENGCFHWRGTRDEEGPRFMYEHKGVCAREMAVQIAGMHWLGGVKSCPTNRLCVNPRHVRREVN